MCRQLPMPSTACPRLGASTGTSMKMIIAVDISRAIVEP